VNVVRRHGALHTAVRVEGLDEVPRHQLEGPGRALADVLVEDGRRPRDPVLAALVERLHLHEVVGGLELLDGGVGYGVELVPNAVHDGVLDDGVDLVLGPVGGGKGWG
jgi:hypothetical protein